MLSKSSPQLFYINFSFIAPNVMMTMGCDASQIVATVWAMQCYMASIMLYY